MVQTKTNTSLQFASYSRYGICEALERDGSGCAGSAPGRFTVSGLLSEVDTPGEFFWQSVERILYIYPFPADTGTKQKDDIRVGFWSGPGLLSMVDSKWVTLRDVTVTSSAGTALTVSGGEFNTVGGCTIKSSGGGIDLSGGYNNKIIGNDIYDVGSHINSVGNDEDGFNNLKPTNNLIANNQMTQLHLTAGTWQIRIRGMGDRFTNNLIHDSPGQVFLPGGPLSLYDYNEIFNTGYVEGDGGVMYSGASLTNGYGVHYRGNFVHHSLEVPGLHGRGGIYFDDHLGPVSNVSHNILYKAAGRAFLVNGGAGINITKNLIINSGNAIYQQAADDKTTALPLYDNGTLHRGDKGDYIYRTEGSLGVPNYTDLFHTNLSYRFPTFTRMLSVNSTRAGWASAMGSNFAHNTFLNNSGGNICIRVNDSPQGSICDEYLANHSVHGLPLTDYINAKGSQEASWEWFPKARELDFSNISLGIQSLAAGLQCDGYRRTMPDKAAFRSWVRAYFEDTPSAAGGHYTPEAAALRASMRSGQALIQNFTKPCPPVVPNRDCIGVWLHWGECMPNKEMILRYTIEREATTGGKRCSNREGDTKSVPCI